MSIVTGIIVFKFAEICRQDSTKCSIKGIHYQEKCE